MKIESRLMKPLCTVSALLLVFAFPQMASPWATRGHSVIDKTAVDALPDDGPVFLKKYANYISRSSTIPDTWRDAPGLFSRIEEDPNHGWFKERLAFMHPIPRSRYEFVIALYKHYEQIKNTEPEAAKYTNVRWTGTLPYAAVETYERLVDDMRRLRKVKAAGGDTSDLEQTCAFIVYWMGHYIGDGSEPLHDTINANGWIGPNPHGYTTDPHIHARFEAQFVDKMKLTEADIMPLIGKPGHLQGDVFEDILAFLDKSGSRQEEIYKLDKRGAFADGKDPQAREMVLLCTSDGARMLRDLIYRAWLESGQPNPNTDPSPVSVTNPRYNPETGSAPATMSPRILHLPSR